MSEVDDEFADVYVEGVRLLDREQSRRMTTEEASAYYRRNTPADPHSARRYHGAIARHHIGLADVFLAETASHLADAARHSRRAAKWLLVSFAALAVCAIVLLLRPLLALVA